MLSLESALRRAGARRPDPAVSARRGPGRLLGLSGRAAGGDPASRNPQARRHVAKRQTVEGRAGPPAPWGKDAPAIAEAPVAGNSVALLSSAACVLRRACVCSETTGTDLNATSRYFSAPAPVRRSCPIQSSAC